MRTGTTGASRHPGIQAAIHAAPHVLRSEVCFDEIDVFALSPITAMTKAVRFIHVRPCVCREETGPREADDAQ